MDPGTALAVVGIALDTIKDLHAYYVGWKDRNEDVKEVRSDLIWLMNLFEAIRATLTQEDLDRNLSQTICDSIKSCKAIVGKLEKKLATIKRRNT
ncbi:hypothetical protein B0J14DRAFT_350655 [Halenospora varia]|nr:hypothetical protein B0J14DRAFT_350655 [Halenospora varia]